MADPQKTNELADDLETVAHNDALLLSVVRINFSAIISALRSTASEADDREALAAWMMANGYATGHGDDTEGLLAELDWQHKERLAVPAA